MTAVASPPSLANLNRPGWINGGQNLNSVNADDTRGLTMFMPRKTLQRTHSSSSVSSTSSNSSTSTVTSNANSQVNGASMPAAGDANGWQNPTSRKRPTAKAPWPNGKSDEASNYPKGPGGRGLMAVNGINGTSSMPQQPSILAPQNQLVNQGAPGRPVADGIPPRQPVLCLLSLNGSFERKTISVPFSPETLRIGRQTNAKTVPTPVNGYFDSKVLSRQHAEIWADTNGKIWIRDVKSSNGTFVNGTRLSPENRESEPHELQTQDHLELGIDIVSEDQRTVVHHKVAAKVEHAGFITPSTNVLDMNLGDLDPSGNGMMLPLAAPPARGRAGNQPSTANANRVPPGNMAGQVNTMAHQRQFWLNPITTEHIVKKLHTEMRNARLQNQDLYRTSQFINALLSKEDIKNADKPEVPEPPKTHLPNGNISFRSDGGKTRFSEPPAPPPSQPLPEKPDAARPASSDVPSLKRATTERPKPAGTSPIRQDNSLNQILLLTEALNNANRELSNHTARVRDLEEMLSKEREARLHAEDMMHRMEESSQSKMNGSADAPLVNGHSELDKAFDPPAEQGPPPSSESASHPAAPELETAPPQPDKAELLAAAFQARIDSMALEMSSLREQLEAFRLRAEKAESERDADRKTLAEMVLQIRQRDEKEKKQAAERKSRSVSKGRRRPPSPDRHPEEKPASEMNGAAVEAETQTGSPTEGVLSDRPNLSRANTIKPGGGALAVQAQQDSGLIQTLPYASMIGVVLFGMGLMAYLNGWQPQPRLDR